MSRPQVRSDHAARLLLALRVLQQHRRVRACTRTSPTRRRRPPLLLWPAGRIEAHDRIAARIAETERQLTCWRGRRARPFEKWIARAPQLRPPVPVAHLAFDAVACRHVETGGRRRRDDTGSGRRRTGTTAGRPSARPGTVAGRERRAAIQRRQQRRAPGRADVRAHGSLLAVDPADADRGAGARGRPASIASVDRRRQPRLRADARRMDGRSSG